MLINNPHTLVKVSFSRFYFFNMQKFGDDGMTGPDMVPSLALYVGSDDSTASAVSTRHQAVYVFCIIFVFEKNNSFLDSELLRLVWRQNLGCRERRRQTFTCSFRLRQCR